jgi:hypothetical protein
MPRNSLFQNRGAPVAVSFLSTADSCISPGFTVLNLALLNLFCKGFAVSNLARRCLTPPYARNPHCDGMRNVPNRLTRPSTPGGGRQSLHETVDCSGSYPQSTIRHKENRDESIASLMRDSAAMGFERETHRNHLKPGVFEPARGVALPTFVPARAETVPFSSQPRSR